MRPACRLSRAARAGLSRAGAHQPVQGGQSNPTYLVEAESGAYVLRRKPPGKLLPSAHAIEREYAVMAALGKAGFPVPKVHHLCSDPEIAGTPFYLMDRVVGRIVWEPAMPNSDRASAVPSTTP